jgi:hypothetical protein
MKRSQLAPFIYELRETIATALFRFEELETAAKAWLNHDEVSGRLAEGDSEQANVEAFDAALAASGLEQLRMFEALEAFLAAWARVSLILFPTAGNQQRADCLREAFEVDSGSILADRELRDSWMHFDERLDVAVAGGRWNNRHRWVRSEVAKLAQRSALRLFAVDTLVIYFRDRRGHTIERDLHNAVGALRHLRDNLRSAWERICETSADAEVS